MKIKFLRKLFLFSSLLISLFCSGLSAEAASFNMSASVQQVAPGGSFTVSVGGDCIGRVDLKVAGGTISTSSVWVEESYQTVSVTAGNSGTVTITATPTDLADSDGNEYKPGSRTTSVKIVTPSQPTTPTQPSNPTPSGTTTQTPAKPQTNTTSNPTTSSDQKPSTDPAESEEPEDEDTDEEVQPEESTEESTDEPTEDEPNLCQALEDNNKLAWTLAGIFALLFCGVTITLLCVVFTYKSPHHTEPEPQPEPEPKPAQKPKSKSTGSKTKQTTPHEKTH